MGGIPRLRAEVTLKLLLVHERLQATRGIPRLRAEVTLKRRGQAHDPRGHAESLGYVPR